MIVHEADPRAVNIMDVIMFEAQRQGRISFYMVGKSSSSFGQRFCQPADREVE